MAMDRLELESADRSFYLIRSVSPVPYILDLTSSQPRVMRFAVPSSVDPLDNRWLAVVSVASEQPGVVTVGSGVRWVVDTAEHAASSETRWVSQRVVSIDRIRGETREILSDPESVEDLLEGLADLAAGRTHSIDEVAAEMAKRKFRADRDHGGETRGALLDEMTRQAVVDGLYDASAEDYIAALQRARGKGPSDDRAEPGHDERTEQANSSLARSGQDDDESAAITPEAYRRLQSQNYDEWEGPPRGHVEADAEMAATAEERRRLLDDVLDEIDERWRDVLDRLGREEGPPES